MRLFLSAGEPSGDLHGANLVRALRQLDPSLEYTGFGGEQMETAGCRLLYPLCRLAVMWFARVFANLATFLRLLRDADRVRFVPARDFHGTAVLTYRAWDRTRGTAGARADLTLADAPDLAAAARPVHLRETVADGPDGPLMTFDYRLRPGIARSSNALRLLELVGIPAEADAG